MSSKQITELVLGGVYQTNLTTREVRVIAFDTNMVFYDVWWEYLNDWGYKDSLKKKVFCYSSSSDRFLKSSTFLRVEPLNEAEQKVYRPDLPHRLFTFKKLSWGSQPFTNIAECEAWLTNNGIDPAKLPSVEAAQLALVPQDAKSNNKKTVFVNAANGVAFGGAELLFHACNAQTPYMTWEDENGIGLHRLGFEKGIPSYYMGSYYDLATLYMNPSLVKKRRLTIQSLHEAKKLYPFKEWRARYKEGFEQFTAANCKKATQIADALVTGLMALKEGTEAQKMDLFKTAVVAYNQLNDTTGGTLLETEEREELIDLLNTISSLAGLNPGNYGNGEGVATEWRDW